MSFGFSPSDIWTLITVTKRAYDGWRSAGKRFEDITDTLHSFQILLKHIHHRYNEVETTTAGLQDRRTDFDRVLRGCTRAVTQLADIARKHEKLRTWDRLRLGLRDITEPKESLVRHMGLLTPFLLITEMESIGKDIRSLPRTFDEIPAIIQSAVTVAFGNMLDARADENGAGRSSVLTTYGDDDKAAYKELRRGLHSLGIKDAAVREHHSELLMLVRSVLSPQTPPEATYDRTRWPYATSNFSAPLGRAPSDFPTLHRDVSCPSIDHDLEHEEWHSSSTAHQVHVERVDEPRHSRKGNGNRPVDGALMEPSRSGIDTSRTDREDGVGGLQGFRARNNHERRETGSLRRVESKSQSRTLQHGPNDSNPPAVRMPPQPLSTRDTRATDQASHGLRGHKPLELPWQIYCPSESEQTIFEHGYDAQSELSDLSTSGQAGSTFFDDASNDGSLPPKAGGRLPYIPPFPLPRCIRESSAENSRLDRQRLPMHRLIEYKPLDVNVEKRLTVQVPLTHSWTQMDDATAELVDYEKALIDETRASFRFHERLSSVCDAVQTMPLCRHGFPSAFRSQVKSTDEDHGGPSRCQIVDWTPSKQASEPQFLDWLRRWAHYTIVIGPEGSERFHHDVKVQEKKPGNTGRPHDASSVTAICGPRAGV